MKRYNCNMTIDEYLTSLDEIGLDKTWMDILRLVGSSNSCFSDGILSVPNFGELYEIGLAHVNKQSKKELGKYFTPDDVATLMSKWFDDLSGDNVCDVCCGVGNLTLAYLRYIGRERARKLIKEGRLWLYDKDELALRICVSAIGFMYGDDVVGHIHFRACDFLNCNVKLPIDCKVISNPPYAKVDEIPEDWRQTEIVKDTHELYAAIVEKILTAEGCRGTVLLTPQNYLGREKFGSLRGKLGSGFSGFVVPFDNIPGQLFNGRKHGVFNTNHQNQVRPAILVTDNRKWGTGIRVAGMVRFRNGERDKVLDPNFLSKLVGTIPQMSNGGRYAKCFPQLEPLLFAWKVKSSGEKFGDHACNDGDYHLNFVTTCRYNTVAYVSNLFRTGKRMILFKDEETRDLAYCWLNSSFCYWHWRLYDGEITYQHGMLNEMPVFFNKLSSETKEALVNISREMRSMEAKHIVMKKNAGKMMESIKFPDEFRIKINNLLLMQLGIKCDGHDFDLIHAHSVMEVGSVFSAN